jgi:hypothetical protein
MKFGSPDENAGGAHSGSLLRYGLARVLPRCRHSPRAYSADYFEGGRFALLAAVPKAVSLLSPVSHLSLSHVSHGLCEPDGATDRSSDRALRH